MKEFRYEDENLDKGEKTQKKEKKLRKKRDKNSDKCRSNFRKCKKKLRKEEMGIMNMALLVKCRSAWALPRALKK